ncbi:MAG: alpha/beta hydrolase [Vulcanimicrobiaceae bacterium]|jgi:triacylglycerol lipase
MRAEIATAVAAVERELSPEMVAKTQAIYAPYHATEPYDGVTVTRDLHYGAAARQRLDVFSTDAAGRPVVVFIHGGGFTRGDKSQPGSPYYDNVGLWAVRSGFVGVLMTYRLAPDVAWPAGADDVDAALRWVAAHAHEFGGDADRIVVVGQSAGAVHAATAFAIVRDGATQGIRGLALLSGIYDFLPFPGAPGFVSYFGDDRDRLAEISPLRTLAQTDLPLLFAVAEYDPPPFHAQAAAVVAAFRDQRGTFPNLVYLPGHNHISEIVHLNADVDDPLLDLHLRAFVTACCGSRQRAGHSSSNVTVKR